MGTKKSHESRGILIESSDKWHPHKRKQSRLGYKQRSHEGKDPWTWPLSSWIWAVDQTKNLAEVARKGDYLEVLNGRQNMEEDKTGRELGWMSEKTQSRVCLYNVDLFLRRPFFIVFIPTAFWQSLLASCKLGIFKPNCVCLGCWLSCIYCVKIPIPFLPLDLWVNKSHFYSRVFNSLVLHFKLNLG